MESPDELKLYQLFDHDHLGTYLVNKICTQILIHTANLLFAAVSGH